MHGGVFILFATPRFDPACIVTARGPSGNLDLYGSRPVRAENRIHSSDQQSCSSGAAPMMITNLVPAARVPPDHAASRVAAAVPA